MNLYYTNFIQVKYFNHDMNEWRKGLCHHEWLLDYEGFAIKLNNINEDDIIELSWRNLKDN